MDSYKKDCSDETITISRTLYDSFRSADLNALLLSAYLERIEKGEMELDFKVVDLINEIVLKGG